MKKFCTSIHCMDGRIQEPINIFIKKIFDVDYIDTITEPGPNKILSEHKDSLNVNSILFRLSISIKKHNSEILFISGHYDCAGNPFGKEEQIIQIKNSINFIKSKYQGLKIFGLWIDENWKVNILKDN